MQTDLSTNSLQKLIDISSHEEFGPAVQNLTVIAVIYDTAYLNGLLNKKDSQDGSMGTSHGAGASIDLTIDELAQARWEQSVLVQREAEQPGPKTLQTQRRNTNSSQNAIQSDFANEEQSRLSLTMLTIAFFQLGRVKNLTLEAAVYKMAAIRLAAYKCTKWQLMWKKASFVFETTMTAIAESRILVERLSVYGGAWGCSVSIYEIRDLVRSLRDKGLQDTTAKLKSLAISVSLSAISEARFSTYQPASSSGNSDLATLLTLCPGLEELDVQVYQLNNGFQTPVMLLSNGHALPDLVRCTLRGLRAQHEAMLRFLRGSPSLKCLEVRNVVLTTQGGWRNILDYCSSEEVAIHQLRLYCLWEIPRIPIRFGEEQTQNEFAVCGDLLKRRIPIQAVQGRDRSLWNHQNTDYGPPEAVLGRLGFDGIRQRE